MLRIGLLRKSFGAHHTDRVRVLGLDVGQRRLGVSLSDEGGRIAQPLVVLERRGGSADLEALVALVRDHAAQAVVLGLPLQLDGTEGTAARRVRAFALRLRRALAAAGLEAVRLHAFDERFTTTQAEAALLEGDVSRRRRREVVDALAAQLILQAWLDRRAARSGSAG
jgi:putative Holliday junction resolvase